MPLNYTDQQISDKAVELGLIPAGANLPRHLRGKAVAALAHADAAERAIPSEPQLAKEIVIQPGGSIFVDGEPFPWIVAAERMDISLDPEPNGLSTVRLTLVASAVQVIRPEPRPESE
ncbi:hypothetical protein [Streptomyces xanthophaeus]|uniref:hypothetical protein n=1 Tax=Streptomyces xanthophaeus TaxID=67385 RepID=UPI003713DA44